MGSWRVNVAPEGMEFSLQGNDKYADWAYVNSVEVNGSFGQAIDNGEKLYDVYFVGEWGEVFNSVETNPVTMKFSIKPNDTGKDRTFFVEIGADIGSEVFNWSNLRGKKSLDGMIAKYRNTNPLPSGMSGRGYLFQSFIGIFR